MSMRLVEAELKNTKSIFKVEDENVAPRTYLSNLDSFQNSLQSKEDEIKLLYRCLKKQD